jgi:hypothetical protein
MHYTCKLVPERVNSTYTKYWKHLECRIWKSTMMRFTHSKNVHNSQLQMCLGIIVLFYFYKKLWIRLSTDNVKKICNNTFVLPSFKTHGLFKEQGKLLLVSRLSPSQAQWHRTQQGFHLLRKGGLNLKLLLRSAFL